MGVLRGCAREVGHLKFVGIGKDERGICVGMAMDRLSALVPLMVYT